MRLQSWLSFVVLIALLLVGRASPAASWAAHGSLPLADWGDGSLLFVENVGQFDPRAHFQVRGGDATLWLAEDGLWITLTPSPLAPLPLSQDWERGRGTAVRPGGGGEGVVLHLSFPGAAPHPRLMPFGRQEMVVNYYRGNDPAQWHTHVPVWGGVRYVDLYPGVDLEITGVGGYLAWRLVAQHATGSPEDVRLRVEGAEDVTVEGNVLRLTTAVGTFTLPLLQGEGPAVPQVRPAEGGGFLVTAPFAPRSAGPTAVEAASALLLGTYLGGSGGDRVEGIAADGTGAVYVTGWTFSTNFPTEGPGATSSLSGNCDAFITKLETSPTGTFRPAYSTYLGGSYTSDDYKDSITESGMDIAVENGAAYVAGYTWSNDFPTTAGAYDTTFNGPTVSPDATPERPGWDGFVVKLDSSGNLAYSTYLGGSGYDVPGGGRGGGDDEARGIAVRDGILYVTGYTKSSDFPTTAGAYDRTYANVDVGLNDDVFVVKLNPAGNGNADLLYGTFVGGGMPEVGNDLAVDGSGVVYVTGWTGDIFGPAITNDFPTTGGAYDPQSPADDVEAFFFRLNPAGNGDADLLYSTFLGGNGGSDYGHAVAVDGAGNVYLVGSTTSSDFPATPGAFDTTCGTDGRCNSTAGWGAYDDVFVAKLNPAGGGTSDLLYATFLGGSHTDGWIVDWADIAIDGSGDVYITGLTSSSDFPLTPDAYDDTYSYTDAFVTRLSLQGKGQDDLVYSTFLGGSDVDKGLGVALESEGVIWIAGYTKSSDFPTTDDAFDKLYNGGGDGFVVKMMAPPPTPDLSPSTKEVNPTVASAGEVVTFTARLVNSGMISATVAFTDTLPASLLLQGTPTASAGPTPTVNGQTITWTGSVAANDRVTITYATLLTSTVTLTPTVFNQAEINDGHGNVYVRRAYVNGHRLFLAIVLKNR